MTPEHIVIHHSATDDGMTFNLSALRNYHVNERGWREVGYHWIVEDVGGTVEVMVGRMPNEIGAHCHDSGMNRKSLGICVVGNFSKDELPQPKFVKLVTLTMALMQTLSISPSKVHRHRDFKATQCPGNKFPWDRFQDAIRHA